MAKRKLIEELGAVAVRPPTAAIDSPRLPHSMGEKHGPVFYLTRNEGGRTRDIYVPPELHDEVAAGVIAYRRYRELGQQIAEANARDLGLGQQRRMRRDDRTAVSAAESVRGSPRLS